MRGLPVAVALALALGAHAPGHAEIRVQARGDRLDLELTNAPLADVLGQLARETGMKVVYDGPPPRAIVTATLRGRTAPEAVLALFEGLGLNFALSLDATGSRIETLMVMGSAASGRAPPPALRGPLPGSRPAPPPEDPASEGEPEEPTPEEPAAPATPPDASEPTAGVARPLPPPGRPSSPFGSRPAPLMFPTPAPSPEASPATPGEPTPEPTPTPPPR